MYNDKEEYYDFMVKHNHFFCTEPLNDLNPINVTALNIDQDWDQIYQEYTENKIVVIDNFFDLTCALRLRNFMLYLNNRQDIYNDYAAVNFSMALSQRYIWFSLLTNIVNESKNNLKCLHNKTFQRAWAFIYDNISNGVNIHADPAAVNINCWVTPEECLDLETGNNGLDIWKIYPPEDWEHQDYNGNAVKSLKFIEENSASRLSFEYRFNRAIMFDSKFFHKTQPVVAKPGYENRRINYTFLYT
jgi:hypothetical protein